MPSKGAIRRAAHDISYSYMAASDPQQRAYIDANFDALVMSRAELLDRSDVVVPTTAAHAETEKK